MTFLCFDCEADNLLPDVTKIHCVGIDWAGEVRVTTDYDKMRSLFAGDYYFVGHNALCYDRPVLEKILGVKIPYGKFIDTLAVSWALHPERAAHSLESWGADFNIEKVSVGDWENGSQELYAHRVTEDIKIQSALWTKLVGELEQLYGTEPDKKGNPPWLSYVKYLSFKMFTLSVQEKFPFKLDIPKCEANLAELEGQKKVRTDALAACMPPAKKYTTKTKPTKCFKKDGTPSVAGEEWFSLLSERGLDPTHEEPIEVLHSEEPPNPSSVSQIKDWLFSLGWKPTTFKEGASGPVAQVKDGDDLCDSVKALKAVSPAIEHLDKLGVLGHRIGLLKGFLKGHRSGYITAGAHGFTSTLRLRHKGVVNIPKPTMEHGKLIREVLTCDAGYEICDSDLAALEDRIRLDLVYDLNPAKVQEKLDPSYDAHLATGVTAGLMTQEDSDWFKAFKKNPTEEGKPRFEKLSEARHKAKTCNYASAYGVGIKKLATTLDIKQAEAKRLLDAYWVINREAKIIQETWQTKQALNRKWILNPYNKYWYELRSERDKLSSVIQGGGDYVCYLWTKFILEKREQLTLVYHDAGTFIVKAGHREAMSAILRSSIEKVNKVLNFKVPMDISINFGENLNVH
jgi:hypothetical protein